MRVSRAQVEEHEFTHTPYRFWCSICVKARGQKMPHLKGKDEEEEEFGVKVIQNLNGLFLYEQER